MEKSARLDIVLAFVWFVIAGASVLLYQDLIAAFINPVLHYPTLYAVNVYRFVWVAFALFAGGVAFGSLLVYFVARRLARTWENKMKKLLRDA